MGASGVSSGGGASGASNLGEHQPDTMYFFFVCLIKNKNKNKNRKNKT